MYVAISGNGHARVIQYREDTRIPGTKKKTTHVVKTIGNYERMLADDPDIIAKLREEAKEITRQKKEAIAPIQISLPVKQIECVEDCTPRYQFGHAIIRQIWKKMGLDKFFIDNCGKRNAEMVANALYYLVAHRCINPDSIVSSQKEQTAYAGVYPVGLDVCYDVLDVLDQQKETVIEHLSSFLGKATDRNEKVTFYDVTTYAFESTQWGELRMFGFSKDHKNNEVQVVMGLLIDSNGIPITYELFPGNTMDQTTLTKAVEKLKRLYNLDKITIVADRGLNSGTNLEFLYNSGHDFVISYTLKKSPQAFRNLVFNDTDWKEIRDNKTGEVLSKSKISEEYLEVHVPIDNSKKTDTPKKRGRPKKYDMMRVPVKIHMTWTKERATKDRLDREQLLAKLGKRLDKPYQLKADMRRGCNQFLAMELDTSDWMIDNAKVAESERFDGYYAYITNNLDLDTAKVTGIYRGLWKIEESFRVLKTDLQARPVFVWNDAHIRGHFLLCYLCLCIIRYIQFLWNQQYKTSISAEDIMRSVREAEILVQGKFPRCVVTPTITEQSFLDLAQLIGCPPLKTNMTLTQFRAATKLDLSINLR
ncbi:IS1634 family transposase [Flexilinea flocculi]|uniref:Transposase DDE domain n=1 Tax=Flexilinea flocculi TaxID=1678840 RepID=A0A0K8PAB1_9CHLR|nr:IS1634 family transposase [Flexilinea flocculi]GAP39085.1 transposase DDE domain [Flexilinea flocculi]